MNILVLAPENDCHAPDVITELKNRGHRVTNISGDNFPRQDQMSIHLDNTGEALTLRRQDQAINLLDADTVWRRRGEFASIDFEALHADDRHFAREEAQTAADGFRDIAALNGARWVNPRHAAKRINNKPYQLALARRAGLSIPETLISNDAADIKAFHTAHHAKVIYKPLTPALFKEDGKEMVSFVNIVPQDVVENGDLLKLSPGIYQPFMDKVFELRVNVFGDQILATRIDNQHIDGAQVDWRSKVHLTPLSEFNLPEWLQTAILKFMREADLVFGALDFIVTRQGEFVFLEVNEMGQFLWLDTIRDISDHLHAMCDLLGSQTKRPDHARLVAA